MIGHFATGILVGGPSCLVIRCSDLIKPGHIAYDMSAVMANPLLPSPDEFKSYVLKGATADLYTHVVPIHKDEVGRGSGMVKSLTAVLGHRKSRAAVSEPPDPGHESRPFRLGERRMNFEKELKRLRRMGAGDQSLLGF